MLRFTKCKTCNTERFPIRKDGHCYKCYHAISLIRKIKKWNPRNPKTLKDFGYMLQNPYRMPECFRAMKRELLRQLQDRLDSLKLREEQYQKGTDGITIEFMLRRLGKRCARRGYNDFHYGYASQIDHTFPLKQKLFLYQLLADIVDRMPWRGLSPAQAFDKYMENQKKSEKT